MNIRKSLRAVSVVWIICCVSMAKADDQGVISSSWETDFTAAKQIAERDSKDLFLNFTGSDWCGFCIALRDKVLTNSAFEQGASEHFVFVELDYPRHKDQSENLRKQNDELRRTFGVKGFPTLMLADAQGRPFAQLSNQPGIEPEQLASQMRSLQGLREKRDVFLSEAESLEGMKRAEKLDEALDLLDDELVERFYGDFTDEIISLDEKDTLKRKKDRGFAKGLNELEQQVQQLARQRDDNAISAAVDAFIKEKKLKGENRQRALMLKLGLYGTDKLETAAGFLKSVESIEPNSDTGRKAAGIRMRVEQFRTEHQPPQSP